MGISQEPRVWIFVVIVGILSGALIHAERPSKPNFVIILADDLGWQDVKRYDIETQSVFETPHMDQLATEGILFRQAYSPAPTCAPSRVGILTGKYPARVGKTHVVGGECPKPYRTNTFRMMDPYYTGRMGLEEITIAEELKSHGYFSGHIGKWHVAVNHNSFPQPMDQGFGWTRHNLGISRAMTDRLTEFATTSPSDEYQLDENGFAYDQTTEDALDFLSDAVDANQPFFCYYASWLVHTPIQIRTERLLEKYAGKMGYSYPLDESEIFAKGQNNPYYAAMVETFDYTVHRIVSYLKETDDPRWPGHKLIENTYIFLTSDNGGMEAASGENITDNYPLDRGKTRAEEGGVRVPFIVLGPGISANVESNVMVNGLDFYPTMLSLAGIPIPDRLAGCDLSSLLLNDPQDEQLVTHLDGSVRDTMYWHFPHGSALHSTIRKDGWKLFRNYDYVDNSSLAPYRLYQLYDDSGNRNDIEEAVDLVDVETALVTQLSTELNTWLSDVNAKFPHYNPKYSNTLTNKDLVLSVLDSGDENGVAWVTFETGPGKADVAYAEMIYTLNGDGGADEEWFNMPAEIVSAGRVEAVIPCGTTHYLFNLIDENNFLVSSVDVGQMTDGVPDSTVVPPYVNNREPGAHTTILYAGTQFPVDDVVADSSVSEITGVPIHDDESIHQGGGQTFTISSQTKLTGLTVQVGTQNTFDEGTHELVFWMGEYNDGIPGIGCDKVEIYELIDVSGFSFSSMNYYTIDFPDAVFNEGSYAFQLAWRSMGSGHDVRLRRANGGGTYGGGGRLFKSSTTSPITLPFSDTSVDETNDVVFALHGSVFQPDIDGDGFVNLDDFARLASWWADDQCQTSFDCMGADINTDGVVDISDLELIVQQWLE